MSKRTVYLIKQKQAEGKHISIANIIKTLMDHGGTQPMVRPVQGEGKWNTSSEFAEARRGSCQR